MTVNKEVTTLTDGQLAELERLVNEMSNVLGMQADGIMTVWVTQEVADTATLVTRHYGLPVFGAKTNGRWSADGSTLMATPVTEEQL